jgi:uncharacterized ion transporter superfamily protein YfcC
MLVVGTVLWVGWTMRYAARNSTTPDLTSDAAGQTLTRRDVIILALLVLPLAAYVYGVLALNWGLLEIAAMFFIAVLLIGPIAGLGLSDTMSNYLTGMQTVVAASVLVGMARSISVVRPDGLVIDTLVQGMAAPLANVPASLAGLGMVPLHMAVHVAVPSVSGQAVLTLPVLIPVSDLIGLTREATVLAYQTGAGLMDMITPTNGAMMAILLGAGVSFSRWMSFILRGGTLMFAVGAAGILIAAALNL